MKRKSAEARDVSPRQSTGTSGSQEPTDKKHKPSALDLIQQYDDEEEETSTSGYPGAASPSSHEVKTDVTGEAKEISLSRRRIQLRVPTEISSMFQCGEAGLEDPPGLEQKHEGRTRSFPHVRGNWASFIHVPVHGEGTRNTSVQLMKDLILETFSAYNYPVNTLDSIHLSLSRTHVFLHHWIQPFIDELKRKLASSHKQELTFQEFIILVNDEKTRTFIGMKVWDCPYLRALVDIADGCLKEYKLEPYYEEPIFHISLGWMLGDQSKNLKPVVQILNERWNYLVDDDASIATLAVTAIAFKYGDRTARFPLR